MSRKVLISGVLLLLTLFCLLSVDQLCKNRIDRLANLTARQLALEVKKFGGVIIHYRGRKLVELYGVGMNPDKLHHLASMTKGVASCAVGFAVQEGLLGLDSRICDIIPEYFPENCGEKRRNLTVRDLLMLRIGYSKEQESSMPLAVEKIFRNEPEFAPGERFYYSSLICYLVSVIVQKAVGMPLADYVRPRMMLPLGIRRYLWEQDGAGGLMMTLPDLAKLGEFYRHKGNWHGVQLLDASWLEEATASQTPEGLSYADNWSCGFGYLFWRNKFGGFRSDGAGGQLLIILPEEELSIAMFSDGYSFSPALEIIESFVLAVRAELNSQGV